MKAGRILHRFTVKDGREVILRTPKWEDLDDLLHFINALEKEDLDFLSEIRKMTRDAEADWLGNRLAEMEKEKVIDLVAEVDGRVIERSAVNMKSGIMSHIGDLTISILLEHRELGIGTEMMKILIKESRKVGLKILVLRVFGNNDRAIHVYEKLRFKETGRIPKGFIRKGKYLDDVTMVKTL